jgi:predicted Zn-dependent protease
MRNSRLIIAAFILISGLVTYYSQRQVNPVTGETQHIAITPDQEVALGLNSAPKMAAEFGGDDPSEADQRRVFEIGKKVVLSSDAAKSPYKFQFHLLADRQTINAFALPGGPVFITRALYDQLENDAQLAGVLGHEVGHVVGRHSAEQMAKSQLAQSMVGAAGVAASDQYGHGQQGAMVAAFVAQMTQLRYGRKDELEADKFGVHYMNEAGYDPHSLIGVMDILEKSSKGGGRRPEFMSTHPDPGNRREAIQAEIAKMGGQKVAPANAR